MLGEIQAMSELIVPPEEIIHEVGAYGQQLTRFVDSANFPHGLLSEPDHVVFKTTDPNDFGNKARAIKPWAEQVAFIQIDWRFLIAARMVVPLALGGHRHVDWVEIIESQDRETRPASADYVGLEYAEFYYSDFNHAEQLIKGRGIKIDRRADSSHRWLNIVMNENGQEVRLSDTKLVEVVSGELESGAARLI